MGGWVSEKAASGPSMQMIPFCPIWPSFCYPLTAAILPVRKDTLGELRRGTGKCWPWDLQERSNSIHLGSERNGGTTHTSFHLLRPVVLKGI